MLDQEEAFPASFHILNEWYNDTFYLDRAFREKLNKQRKVGGSDSLALRCLVDNLKKQLLAAQNISDLSILDDDAEKRKMCEKSPGWLRQRCNRISHQSKLRERRLHHFNCFISFVVKEEGITNAPLGRQPSDKTKPEIKGNQVDRSQQKRLKTLQNSQLLQTQLHIRLPRQHFLLCRKYLRQKHNKLSKQHYPMKTLYLSQQPPVLDMISQNSHRLLLTATFAAKSLDVFLSKLGRCTA